MKTIPEMNLNKRKSKQPHVVILGAGASLASFPKGDKNGRLLPLMNNLISTVKLEPTLSRYGVDYNGENFEALYSDLASEPSNSTLLSALDEDNYRYFSELVIPHTPTLFDYLLLALREKDIVATFNWDPFLAQAYHRICKFTKRLPKIVFLHGNVALGICRNDRIVDFLYNSNFCSKCEKPFERSRLLYPVKSKNYTEDDFINDQWEQLQNHINEAYMITIFGYSAPATDIEAKSLLEKAWKSNSMQDLAYIDIVDIKGKRELIKTWEQFGSNIFTTAKKIYHTYLFNYPRRSCEALQMATLQQDPWSDNPYPKFRKLEDLYQWIAPLISEEDADERLSSTGAARGE